jgi:hypothetical protein
VQVAGVVEGLGEVRAHARLERSVALLDRHRATVYLG